MHIDACKGCNAEILLVWDVSAPLYPEDCSVCGHPKAHAPCILNLATGEIGELELYQPHFAMTGEISDTQRGGTFSFIYAAGLTGIKLTDPWYIEIPVPVKGERKNDGFYCEKCLKLLDEYEQGFVLIDMYDVAHPIVYDLADGATYIVRCYQIEVSAKWENSELLIRVDGRLHGEQGISAE